MSLPTLRLSLLRRWPSAPDVAAGLQRLLQDAVLVLPASLPEAERDEIVDLLILFLDLPVRVVAYPEEARSGELSILAFPMDRDPKGVRGGVLVCSKRRTPGDARLEITDKIIALRDAVIEVLGRQRSGTRLQAVATWASEAADSPSTALRFAEGAFRAHLEDPTVGDAALYTAGLGAAVAGLLRDVDIRVAEWTVALATGAPHPGRLVSSEAQLLGQDAAVLRALDAGLVLFAPEEPGGALELRRPLEILRHLDGLMVALTLADVARAFSAVLDPRIRLVFDKLLQPDRKKLGLEGPRPVPDLLGREDMIERLVTLFDPAAEIRTVVLYSSGGAGKRQVAAALCDRLAARFEPVWVRFAEGPEAGWLRVAGALGIDVNRPEAVSLDREGVPRWVRRVHDALRFLPCLLVVEGADTVPENDLPRWLPTGEGTSAVLVLSRSAQRPLQRAHEAIAVRLGGLSVEASRRLLAMKAPRFEEAIGRGDADRLIDHVGGNPSSLLLAASLLDQKSLLEVTSAVRRGEAGIPEVVREVIEALPEGEAAVVGALAVCAPSGSPPDLAFLITRRDDGREALDGLVDRAMIVGGGRAVRLVEVVRLEAERRLDRKKEARRALERKHARAVKEMFEEARQNEDLTTRENLYADLVMAAERATAQCKAGERRIADTVAGLGYELSWYAGGDAGENARLSIEAYQAALAIKPENMGWQRGLSLAHNRMGNFLQERGDTMNALAAYRAALEISEHLATQEPANMEWRTDLVVSHTGVGDTLLAQGNKEGALVAYRASFAIAESLAQKDHGHGVLQHNLMTTHAEIGSVLLDQGDKKGALASYESGLAIADRLAQQDPLSAEWQRDLSMMHNKIGDVLLAQGDKEGALAAYRASLTICERLGQKDPANATWQRDIAVSHGRIGNVLLAQGDKEGALVAYQAYLSIVVSLAQRDPANIEWQRDLAITHEKLGDVLLAKRERTGAVAAYQMSLAIRERLARHDPANARWQADLGEACWQLAAALVDGTAADRAVARALLERAHRIVTDLAASSRLTHEQQEWLPKIDAALHALPPWAPS